MRALVLGVVLAVQACGPSPVPPGMALRSPRVHAPDPSLLELARLEPGAHGRALLVVYPRTACSATARSVFVDARGTFLGALAPGTAALLRVPVNTDEIFVLSSVDVTAPPRSWAGLERAPVPPPPNGLRLEALRWSARECGSGQYAKVTVASKGELEATLAEAEIDWLEPRAREGQAWLDAHRHRVHEVLAQRGTAPPSVLGYEGPLLGRSAY